MQNTTSDENKSWASKSLGMNNGWIESYKSFNVRLFLHQHQLKINRKLAVAPYRIIRVYKYFSMVWNSSTTSVLRQKYVSIFDSYKNKTVIPWRKSRTLKDLYDRIHPLCIPSDLIAQDLFFIRNGILHYILFRNV
jgi:hypothetical protein